MDTTFDNTELTFEQRRTVIVFSKGLEMSVYETLVKQHPNNIENIQDFAVFCNQNGLVDQANENPEKMYQLFSIGEPINDYLEIYEESLSHTLGLYESEPATLKAIVNGWYDSDVWDPMASSMGVSPVEIFLNISQADTLVVMKGEERPDVPVPSSTTYMIIDGKMEFEPVVIENRRVCWKFRAGWFFGQSRRVDKVAPEILWESLDKKLGLEKILETS